MDFAFSRKLLLLIHVYYLLLLLYNHYQISLLNFKLKWNIKNLVIVFIILIRIMFIFISSLLSFNTLLITDDISSNFMKFLNSEEIEKPLSTL